MRLEYLLFNFFIILFPSLAYFLYPRAVKPQAKATIFSIGLPAFFFIVWDILATGYFWNFNLKYISGYKLLTIPIEEALFFFTVPFACLFLYVNFVETFKNKIFLNPILLKTTSFFFILLGFVFFILGKYYTFAVFFSLGTVWLLDFFFLKTNFISKYNYWQFMIIVLILTTFFNYYLTSRPVVIYNNNLNLNFRILTIPIEDFIYSICLISLVLIIYEFISSREKNKLKI